MGSFVEYFLVASWTIYLVSLFIPEITKYLSFNIILALREPWRWISDAFVHAGFFHILLNSIVIYSLGSSLERRIGTRKMVEMFILSVIFSNLMFGLINPRGFAVGSSGFAFAIIGAVTVLMPNAIVLLWFFPMRMIEAGVFLFFMELFLALAFPHSNIAHIAHVAGFIIGILYAMDEKKKKRRYFIYY